MRPPGEPSPALRHGIGRTQVLVARYTLLPVHMAAFADLRTDLRRLRGEVEVMS